MLAATPEGERLGDLLFYPRLDKISSHLDWRLLVSAVAEAQRRGSPPPEFAEAAIIAADAWTEVVAYVEQAWTTHLLPKAALESGDSATTSTTLGSDRVERAVALATGRG